MSQVPMQIRDFDYAKKFGPLKYFNLTKEKIYFMNGKRKSDDVGVRKIMLKKFFMKLQNWFWLQ